MEIRTPIGMLALAVVCTCVQAGTIFKSVERDGKVTFSDRPLDGAVVLNRIETSDSGKPVVSEESRGGPIYLALADGFDEAVRLANSKVDLAERALAASRRPVVGDYDPIGLNHSRPSPEARRQIEFYKTELITARRNLMRTLQQRNALMSRSAVG